MASAFRICHAFCAVCEGLACSILQANARKYKKLQSQTAIAIFVQNFCLFCIVFLLYNFLLYILYNFFYQIFLSLFYINFLYFFVFSIFFLFLIIAFYFSNFFLFLFKTLVIATALTATAPMPK